MYVLCRCRCSIPPLEGVQKTPRIVSASEGGTAGEEAGSVRLEKCIQRGEIFFGMGECGLEVLAVEFPEGDERGGGQGPGRRRGLTVSSVVWISSMGTESPGGKTGSNSICGEDGYSQIVFLKILKFLRILYFYRK